MNVLVIGAGGREHALAWKLAQSPDAERVYVAPGNAGTALEPGLQNVDIAADDIPGLIAFAHKAEVKITIVGPEGPLVAGIVDAFQDAGLRIFGPGRDAAQLEGSKAFSKAFLQRHGIPSASYQAFTEVGPALEYVRSQGAPIVVKADGLAAGKGVILAQTEAEAEQAIRDMLADNRFGSAGARVVIESFLTGEEASFIVMADGEHVLPMATSQDHKAAHDGDTGPNTGGMGAYSPAPVITEALEARVMEEVIMPTIRGLAAEGMPYTGFLYAGLMIDEAGTPQVLEFNCRFGDPETQPIMLRLESDLLAHCLAATEGTLDTEVTRWSDQAALGVVMAAGGYPGEYRKGDEITGATSNWPAGTKVFHAGTQMVGDRLVTAGGRVLCCTALGDTIADAQKNAYAAVRAIDWRECRYRTDIGHHAIRRLTDQ